MRNNSIFYVYFTLLLVVFNSHSLTAQDSHRCETENQTTLTINFTSDKAKGVINMSVYDSKENFLTNYFKQKRADMLSGEDIQVVIEGLCLGHQYSIASFLDENDNQKLDKNFVGMPQEPYGFSKNVKGTFGPPSFEETKITLDQKNKQINITLD
ncbi:hypothetical protein I215_09052 [Galbibacter marinus]|uniref:DUF2141 domain-containing protein n=1 Tax=Galbibacter marinus TaxID=555500 RepID=K2Q2W1_9FLAO|nr:DUF2141 domain-containing protein [Galbibacter marinus]EKF55166.1 hypothetical protein I215_09052 [Galbibacter marinus]